MFARIDCILIQRMSDEAYDEFKNLEVTILHPKMNIWPSRRRQSDIIIRSDGLEDHPHSFVLSMASDFFETISNDIWIRHRPLVPLTPGSNRMVQRININDYSDGSHDTLVNMLYFAYG